MNDIGDFLAGLALGSRTKSEFWREIELYLTANPPGHGHRLGCAALSDGRCDSRCDKDTQ